MKKKKFKFSHLYLGLVLAITYLPLIMVVISTIFAYLIGLPLGVLLVLTGDHGIWPHKNLNRVLAWIINIGRSLPFIILMIANLLVNRLNRSTRTVVK